MAALLLACIAVIIVFQMSSITRSSYPSMTRWLAQLGAKLESGSDYCRSSIATGCSFDEIVWTQFEQDIWCAYRTLLDLVESLHEEWAVNDRLAEFVSSLEVTNTELVQENRHLLLNAEEAQRSIEELTQLNAQLTAQSQCKRQQSSADLAANEEEKYFQMRWKELELQLHEKQRQIQQLQAEKKEFENELALKNTEIELAEIVIHEMREKKALQLQSTLSPQRQASCEEERYSSEKQIARRHNSLMQDLVESQLVYEPCLSSQMFKSTETIQETIEDFRGEVSCLEQNSNVRSKQSKATWARISTNPAQTQTEPTDEWLCVRYYRAVKDKLVSSRIKK